MVFHRLRQFLALPLFCPMNFCKMMRLLLKIFVKNLLPQQMLLFFPCLGTIPVRSCQTTLSAPASSGSAPTQPASCSSAPTKAPSPSSPADREPSPSESGRETRSSQWLVLSPAQTRQPSQVRCDAAASRGVAANPARLPHRCRALDEPLR